MKIKITLPACMKKKQKQPGEGIKPKGVHHSVVPTQWAKEWKHNDLEEIHSKKTIII